MTNDERAARAEQALSDYAVRKGPRENEEPLQDIMSDLLTDLRHLAARDAIVMDSDDGSPMDFDAAVRTSEIHFNSEQDEET